MTIEEAYMEQSIVVDNQLALIATAYTAYDLQFDISLLEKEIKENTQKLLDLQIGYLPFSI
jgi:cell division protein FtsL